MRLLTSSGAINSQRLPLALALIATLLALLLYLATLAPGLTWQHQGADSGDLATAVAVGGVPHPPGFPTYVLLGRAFRLLLPVGDTAFRLNVMSAVLGAAAVGLTFLLTRTVLLVTSGAAPGREGIRSAAASLGSAALASGPLLWSQSTLAEVYTLNAALFALIPLLALHWWRQAVAAQPSSSGRWPLLLAALLLGLGLGNHPTLAVLLVVGVPLLLGTSLLSRGDWALLALAMVSGLLVYLYLPLAAAGSPPVNWGRPSSLSGFWWTISGTPYRGYLFGLPLSQLPSRLVDWSDLLYQHFNLLGVIVGVLGAWHLLERSRSLLLLIGGPIALLGGYSALYFSRDSFLYLIPAALAFSVLVGVGASWLLSAVVHLLRFRYVQALFWLGIFGLGPALTLSLNYGGMDLSNDQEVGQFIDQVITQVPPGSMVLAASDTQAFALWYAAYVAHPEQELIPVLPPMVLLSYEWYTENLRANHPGAIPELSADQSGESRLTQIIEHNLPQRAVYLTYEERAVQLHFQLTPQGDLWRVGAMPSSSGG